MSHAPSRRGGYHRKPYGMERHQTLTAREMDVAKLLGRRLGNKAISKELHISLNTVKNHIHHMLEKTGCRTRLELGDKFLPANSQEEPVQEWKDAKRILEAAVAHSYWCDGRILTLEWTLKSIIGSCEQALEYLKARDLDDPGPVCRVLCTPKGEGEKE